MANTFNLGNGNWAQKTEKLLAYNAENDNYKPLPFDFDRGSTATRVNKDGLIETVGVDEPRIDYTGNTKGHLLLEPQRTNLITYSEDLTQWQKLNSTVTDNSIVSPDGTQNADLVNYSITSSNGYIRLAHTASQTVTFYIKYKDLQWIMVYGSGLGAGKFIDIKNNIIGGNVGSGATAEIVDANNGWKRVTLSSTSANITQTSIYAASSDGSYATITITGGIYLWGAQAEVGSYATSYIPTSGSAVTRSAETCSQTTPDGVIGQTEGTLYFEGTLFESPSGSNMQLALSDDTVNNQIKFVVTSATTNIEFSVKDGGSTQVSINQTILPNVNNKYAIAYKANDFVMYVNGAQSGSDTSGSVPTITKISFDREDGNNPTHGKIKDLQLYNTRLSNSELQALTS